MYCEGSTSQCCDGEDGEKLHGDDILWFEDEGVESEDEWKRTCEFSFGCLSLWVNSGDITADYILSSDSSVVAVTEDMLTR